MLPLDPTMCKWFLRAVNADQRSVFEIVEVRGFRAPTTDDAQRAWRNLVEVEYGLVMPIISLILDDSLVYKKLPVHGSEAASRPSDPYANRDMARVIVGNTTLSLDEYLRRQRLVNDGARAASPILFNAGMYIYRHLNAYNKSARPFQTLPFEKEYTLFTQFADEYSGSNKSLDIYGIKTPANALFRKVVFLCPGCRRHCTTFVPLNATPKSVHWCGAIVCEIAGPLSDAVTAALTHQPMLELLTPSGYPVNLLRGSGCTATVLQLTQGTNIDESLRLWCAIMNGELVAGSGVSNVWVPSATAWRFRSMWDTEYSAEFNWPANFNTLQWQAVKRGSIGGTTTTCDAQECARRCKKLSRQQCESAALMALEKAAAARIENVDKLSDVISATFPALLRVGSDLSLLARIVCYFQHTRTRMCQFTRDVFVSFFMETGSAELVGATATMSERDTPHNDALELCVCSRLPSFLTTNSNRISATAHSTPRPRTVNHMQSWRGCEFVDMATDAWQRRWGTKAKMERTRVQDLKVHIANLNVSMTTIDATSIQNQTQGTRVLADLMYTPLPFAPLDLLSRDRRCATPVEVHLALSLTTCVHRRF